MNSFFLIKKASKKYLKNSFFFKKKNYNKY